jgi:hypothetical protein
MSNFDAVELNIEHRTSGTSIASQEYTPNINIGNVASNNFSSPQQQTFEFDVTEQGDYTIAIYSAASEWSDCIVGQLILSASSYVTGVDGLSRQEEHGRTASNTVYDLMGRKVGTESATPPMLPKGVYIVNGRKVVVK